jgi:hypothetical protein
MASVFLKIITCKSNDAYLNTYTKERTLDSSISIATAYGLDGRGSIPLRSKIFLFAIASRPALGSTKVSIE